MTKTRFYNLLWILLTGLGTGLWISCVWPVIDDLAYLHRVVEPDYWALSGGLIENQAQLAESIVNHYTMVNSRLANLMALAVLTLPRAMFRQVIHSVAMGNAADYVKEHASEVTASNNEEGVLKALKKYQVLQ